MDMRTILTGIQTISSERREDLLARFEADALTNEERTELEGYVLAYLENDGSDAELAKALMKELILPS